jgi:Plasmid pRiA4b ORF-3-like protein
MPTSKSLTTKPSGGSVYQLKITLKDSKPPIWRRVQVPADVTLAKLHQIIQAAMGWYDSHLHQFTVRGTSYGEPHPDYGFEMKNERSVKLNQVAPTEKSKLVYQYDFGDDWEHDIVVEKILPAEAGVRYPVCLTGKRACPPEDVGGVWGYEAMLEAINDPKHPEHDDMIEWLEEDFDPEAFDLEVVNRRLKNL